MYTFMLAIPRWIWWAEFPNGEGKKPRKVPCNEQGVPINHLDPANHMTYEQCLAGTIGTGLHLGFVILKDDPIQFLDLDKCLMPDGTWSVESQKLMSYVPGALQEVSVSGTGLHALWCWDGPMPEHCNKNASINAEFYSADRFLALGNMTTAVGDVSTVIDPAQLIADWFPPKDETLVEWRTEPVPEWNGHADDAVLIADACKPRANDSSVFGGGGEYASFKALWTGEPVELSRHFPGDGDNGIDWSRVDHALAKQLSYHTGKNHARVEHLMRQSGIVRDKWDKHKEYLKAFTITDAVNKTKSVHGEKKDKPPPEPAVTVEGITTGILMGNQVGEYFKDVVYVVDEDKAMTPKYGMLKQSQFKSVYGGQEFVVGDATETGSKLTTKNAWDGLLNNKNYKPIKVDTTCFRPDLPACDVTRLDKDTTAVNICRLPHVPMIQGDVSPLHGLMQTLWPQDWRFLWVYMCWVVQNPGVKAMWMPLMQGPQGCGKGIINKILSYGVGGPNHKYVHSLDPGDIDNNFNAFIAVNLFIHIDEISMGNAKNKWAMMDKMKVYITEDRVAVTPKGVDQTTKMQSANFMASTNEKTGVPIQQDDRRWGIFWTEPQDYEDLLALGLTTDYFKSFVDWLKKEGGFEICAYAMKHAVIPDELSPSVGMMRAPITSTRAEAVATNLGRAEQAILDAFDIGGPGFKNGMTSSAAIHNYLEGEGVTLPKTKYITMMQSLGYVRLPALKNNRYKVNSSFLGEEGKPVLYARKHHDALRTKSPAEARQFYINTQGYELMDKGNAHLKGVPNG